MRPALVNALSGFWTRYFRDMGDIEALLGGVEALSGQLYLDLLNSVLGAGVQEAPLYRRETYRLWSVRDSDIQRVGGSWRVKKPVPWRNIKVLQDRVVAPQVLLDVGSDFSVSDSYVTFSADPRTLFPAAAVRTEMVPVGGLVETTHLDQVTAGDLVEIDGLPKLWRVSFVHRSYFALAADANLPRTISVRNWRPAGGSTWYSGTCVGTRLDWAEGGIRNAEERVWGLWAIDTEVDDYTLYYNIGHWFEKFSDAGPVPSTEAYRLFLQGLLRLYSFGPTMRRMEEGLSAVAGLPLVLSDGEVVTAITTAAGLRTVVTDKNSYVTPESVPLRSDVVVGATLEAFQTLTNAINVTDTVEDPYWWLYITVPQRFLPRITNPAVRVADPALKQLLIRTSGAADAAVIGNPTTKIGDTWFRTIAYTAMNMGVKHSLFGVKIHTSLGGETIARLKLLVDDVRPATRYPYVWAAS